MPNRCMDVRLRIAFSESGLLRKRFLPEGNSFAA
jgi:hypothetical protein